MIWNLKDNDGTWIKLKFRGDLSSLDDVFEYMEDNPSKYIKKGRTLSMYYGSMSKLIENGELIKQR